MAKKPDTDIGRLLSSIQEDLRFLKPYRERRVDAVAKFAGANWSDDAAIKEQPVNLISLFVQVVARQLIPKNPRMMLSTFQRENKPAVGTMESWINQKIEDIDLAGTLRRCRVDGLFSMGIIKVALGTPADAARFSWRMTAGEPFAEIVDLNDFFCETSGVRDFSQAGYMGHFYSCPLDVVRDDSRNYSKARKDLTPSTRTQVNPQGDQRIEMLGGWNVDKDGFEDRIDLCEVFMPRQKCVYTFTADQVQGACARGDYNGLEPLRWQPWIGPECGPYHILADMIVPGNLMPKAMIMDLLELHDAANAVMRKLKNQVGRYKEVLPTQGQDEDVERIKNTEDGGVVRTSGPNVPKGVAYGGPAQSLMAASMMFQEQFSKHAGNLETMGGLSAQAGTLGQERLLAENSNRAIADLQGNTITFVGQVCKALCWYWWHDPFKVMRVKLPVSQGMEITRKLTPQKRMETPWQELKLKLDPYSMQSQTPESKLKFIMETVTKLALPIMPLLQQSGVGFDVSKLFEIVGELGDCPEIAELFTIQEAAPVEPAAGPGGGGGAPAGLAKPAQTERTYNRVSQSTATGPGQNQMRLTALMGVNPGGASGGDGDANGNGR